MLFIPIDIHRVRVLTMLFVKLFVILHCLHMLVGLLALSLKKQFSEPKFGTKIDTQLDWLVT